jgi:hypothetical protein
LVGGGAFILLSNPRTKNSDQIVQAKNSTSSKTQADKTDKSATVVKPGVDNTNKEITNDNAAVTVAGAATNIADKTGDSPVITNQKIMLPANRNKKLIGMIY